jgi:cytochrome b6-f complex iron-sulfur subunit
MPLTRRSFCTQACCAASLALLPPVLAGCNSPTAPSLEDHPIPSVNAAIVNSALVVTIDATSPLATTGSAALIENGLGKFLVARTGAETFLAVTAVCTHFGCTITRHDNQIYECPCHGSRFSTAGAVVRGPASRPLRSFATQFANDVLTISV